MTIDSPVQELKGAGTDTAQKMAGLGIETVGELVGYFPRRYEDYSDITPIDKLHPGGVTIEATISQSAGRYVRRGLHITEAIASDDSGSVRLVWFNQPYRSDSIKPKAKYFISGEYGLRRGRFSITSPSMELASDFPVNTARIIPVYRETKGLKSNSIRRLMAQALHGVDSLDEHLPTWLLKEERLLSYASAVKEMHFPSSGPALSKAKRRLGFEEVFELTLAALLNKQEFSAGKALSIKFKQALASQFVTKLPFELTDAQRKVAWRILQDMERTSPMNRLVEGDVGSGKTVVAAMAAIMAIEQGFQVAFMAPTEILARQHADTLLDLLSNVGMGDRVSLLIGGLGAKQKKTAHSAIKMGAVGLMVGTHALISEQVDMHKLGLVVIDEQHRFGVQQRKKLQAKAGHMPHVLHMTATPIPRSLALTLYGELDISVLDEQPPGRRRVITKVVSPNSRAQINDKIKPRLTDGQQMFVVCPLIADSETSGGLSVEEVYKRISEKDFKGYRVGLMHGRLKSEGKDGVMREFLAGKLDILVSTTVIEVGIDVPNASIMLVEGVERFGLAQIHQLRGRVGRGEHQSYCYLVSSDSRDPGTRLRALESTSDGFELAELDLRLRGPGAIYGTLQHGALDLKVAQLSDTKLIAAARTAAQNFIDKKENLEKYPHLSSRVGSLRAVTNLN